MAHNRDTVLAIALETLHTRLYAIVVHRMSSISLKRLCRAKPHELVGEFTRPMRYKACWFARCRFDVTVEEGILSIVPVYWPGRWVMVEAVKTLVRSKRQSAVTTL
jgi:hypothetical protein